MANTFELIASYTASGSVSQIDFNSIPSTFTDLCLKVSARNTSTNDYYWIRFNGVSTNLSGQALAGEGSGTPSAFTIEPYARMNGSGTTSNTFASSDIYITNYAGSNNKSLSVDSVSENNGTLAFSVLLAGLWSSSSAITSINLVPSGNSFATNTTAYLYGVKNA